MKTELSIRHAFQAVWSVPEPINIFVSVQCGGQTKTIGVRFFHHRGCLLDHNHLDWLKGSDASDLVKYEAGLAAKQALINLVCNQDFVAESGVDYIHRSIKPKPARDR